MTESLIPSNSTPASSESWKGLTLDELKFRRAKALVKREVGKERINNVLDNMRTRVADNGVRGLLFSNNAIAGLKTADYVFLGWRLVEAILKRRRRRRK